MAPTRSTVARIYLEYSVGRTKSSRFYAKMRNFRLKKIQPDPIRKREMTQDGR